MRKASSRRAGSIAQPHRGGKAAQQRGDRRLGDIDEAEGLLLLAQLQHPGRSRRGGRLPLQAQRQVAARRGRAGPPPGGCGRAPSSPGPGWRGSAGAPSGCRSVWRRRRRPLPSSSGVPAWLYQSLNCVRSTPAGLGHGPDEVVDGDRLAVVALEVEAAGPRGNRRRPSRVCMHADHLGPLVVDGDGVEVVDLHVGGGPHRVGHGAGVLGELGVAQHPHVLDALDRPARSCRRRTPGRERPSAPP